MSQRDTSKVLKSFWERPEGNTGLVFIAAMVTGISFASYHVLPYIVSILKNTTYTVLLLAGLICFAQLITSSRVRTLASYLFQSIMRAITGLFVIIDPIGIVKNHIQALQKDLKEIDLHIAALRGQIKILDQTISENSKIQTTQLGLAKRAQSQGKSSQLFLSARRAGRLQQSNLTLQDLKNKLEMLYRVLCKMRDVAVVISEDMTDEVNVAVAQRKAMQPAYTAFKKAARILRGQNVGSEIYDQAMEFMAEDFARKVGEIEGFLEMSQGFLGAIDLQNGAFEEDALAMLQDWEKKGESILFGAEEKRKLIDMAYPDVITDVDIELPTKDRIFLGRREAKYSDLLN